MWEMAASTDASGDEVGGRVFMARTRSRNSVL